MKFALLFFKSLSHTCWFMIGRNCHIVKLMYFQCAAIIFCFFSLFPDCFIVGSFFFISSNIIFTFHSRVPLLLCLYKCDISIIIFYTILKTVFLCAENLLIHRVIKNFSLFLSHFLMIFKLNFSVFPNFDFDFGFFNSTSL